MVSHTCTSGGAAAQARARADAERGTAAPRGDLSGRPRGYQGAAEGRPRGYQGATGLWRGRRGPLSLLAHGVDVGLGYVEEVGTHAVLTLGAWGVVGDREGQ